MNKKIIFSIVGITVVLGGCLLLTGCGRPKDYTLVAQQYFKNSNEDYINHVKSLCESDEYYKQEESYYGNFYSDKERKLACTTKQKDIDKALKLKESEEKELKELNDLLIGGENNGIHGNIEYYRENYKNFDEIEKELLVIGKSKIESFNKTYKSEILPRLEKLENGKFKEKIKEDFAKKYEDYQSSAYFKLDKPKELYSSRSGYNEELQGFKYNYKDNEITGLELDY